VRGTQRRDPTVSRLFSTCALFACCTLTPWAASAEDIGPLTPAEPAEPAATQPPAAKSSDPAPAELEETPSTPPTDVTILGTRVARAPGSAHVIRSRELERFNYDDPHLTLQKVPGVYVRGEDGVGLRPNISLRGVNPDRSKKLTLLEDGIPFGPAPYSAPAAYYFPLITRMAQVRVIKGPAALTYGPQTIGGAIDLVTRNPPSTPSGAVDLALGEYGYNKVHGYFGSSDERTGFLIEGVHLGSDGFKELPDGADTGFHRNEWMFKGFVSLAPGSARQHELRLKATYSDEVSNETYLGLSDADFRAQPLRRYGVSALDRMRWYRTSFALTHELEASDKLSFTTTLYRHDLFRVWRKVNGFRGASLFEVLTNPDDPANAAYYGILNGTLDSTPGAEAILIGPNQRDFVSQGLEFKARLSASTGPLEHRFEYGVRVHQDRIERRHSEDAFNVIGGELVPEGSPTVVTAANEDSTEALALHAVDAISVGRLTLTPGVRVEVIHSDSTDSTEQIGSGESSNLLHVVLPGAGAYYGLTESLGVLAGVYRGFSPPAPGGARGGPGELVLLETVDSELSVNYEAGARLSNEPLRAEVIGFYNDYSNLSDVCTLSSGCRDQDLDRQFDAGRARIYGLEAFFAHELQALGLSFPLSVAYTLTFAEFANTFESQDPIFQPDPELRREQVEAGDELPYVPRHQLNASFAVESERVAATIGLNYVSKMREQPGPGEIEASLHTDEQVVVDVGGALKILRPLTLYTNVRNLFDSHQIVSRRPYGARPNAPRWVQVGAKVTF
jgi:Fe(3+) dicitrate transport protein